MILSDQERARLIGTIMSASSTLYSLIQRVDGTYRAEVEPSVQQTIAACDALVDEMGFSPGMWNPVWAARMHRVAVDALGGTDDTP
jgi:hypothetical protein